MNIAIGTQQRILDAAIQIANKNGIKGLTQPKVAQAAGVRQSHLTYYFPRKADLLAAVLEASHHRGEDAAPKDIDEALAMLNALMFTPKRMRFFLGAVIEAEEGAELRNVLSDHASALTNQIAQLFNRPSDDPAVEAFIDRIRGMGIRLLLERKRKADQKIDLKKIAWECGLT
ncbi:MAG: helix-turn-helix domain-containing protein [Methylocystis sp.]